MEYMKNREYKKDYIDSEKLIGEALLNPEKVQINQDKILIHTMVCREIFCPACSKVMDSKKAVMVEYAGRETIEKVFCSRVCAEKTVARVAESLPNIGFSVRISEPWKKVKTPKTLIDRYMSVTGLDRRQAKAVVSMVRQAENPEKIKGNTLVHMIKTESRKTGKTFREVLKGLKP
jgi:succinate dehydrogenase/fumarate reductase-like Fe-S protein